MKMQRRLSQNVVRTDHASELSFLAVTWIREDADSTPMLGRTS
jgi:hypothetical protein